MTQALPKAPPQGGGCDVTIHCLRPLRLCHNRSSPPQGRDQGPVPHLGTRGSHKRVASESWDVAFARLPPHPAQSHAAGFSYPHRQPALSSATVPARCSFKTTNCSSRRPGAPPTGGANSGLCPRHRGPCEESDRSETRRAPRLTLLSREYFLNALIPATESGLSVPLQV